MKQINYTDVTSHQLKALITDRESFVLLGIRGNITDSIKKVETEIESQGLKCRVNTDFKAGVAAAGGFGVVGAFLAAPTAVVVGGILAGQAAHTVFTLNPDYVITKDYINAKLTIEFKKKK
jgi:hypothetical protein